MKHDISDKVVGPRCTCFLSWDLRKTSLSVLLLCAALHSLVGDTFPIVSCFHLEALTPISPQKMCIHKLLCCHHLKHASTTKLCPLKEAHFYFGSQLVANILHLCWLVINQAGHSPLPVCDVLLLNWWSLENQARGSEKGASRVCWTQVARRTWDIWKKPAMQIHWGGNFVGTSFNWAWNSCLCQGNTN